MCRLALLSDDKEISSPHYVVMTYLLTLSERSGNTHGMGIGTNTDFIKFAQNASVAVLEDAYIEWVVKSLKSPTNTLLGHTRLASGVFRKDAGDYKLSESHPFSFGGADSWGSVYHNGTFKEYESMATLLGLPADHGLTDTAIFAQLLYNRVCEGVPTPEDLIAVYEVCGKADYSMFIAHNNTPSITVVRGNKPLYKAKSNYGLLINTDQTNLKELPFVVNPGLKLMGYDVLEVETPIFIPMWTINTVLNGTFTKVQDIDGLKKISDPPYTVVYNKRNLGYQQNVFDNLANTAKGSEEIDMAEVATRAESMLSVYILALDGALGNEELDRMFSELYGEFGPWFSYTMDQLDEVTNLCAWIWSKFEQTKVTEEKLRGWNAFKEVCIQSGHFNIAGTYGEANKMLEGGFENPWFLNDVNDFDTLSARLAEVVFDETADDNWSG